MCSAIITRNILNAVHTVLQDLLLPPRSTKIVSYYNWWAGTLILVLQIFMHEFCINMHEFAWTHMNFAWTRINMHEQAWTLHEHVWKLIQISGFTVDIWAMWPVSEISTLIFCGSIWRPYYSTQNMWNSFTSIINRYIVASTFMPQPLLWKSAFFAMNKYICLWREKG